MPKSSSHSLGAWNGRQAPTCTSHGMPRGGMATLNPAACRRLKQFSQWATKYVFGSGEPTNPPQVTMTCVKLPAPSVCERAACAALGRAQMVGDRRAGQKDLSGK